MIPFDKNLCAFELWHHKLSGGLSSNGAKAGDIITIPATGTTLLLLEDQAPAIVDSDVIVDIMALFDKHGAGGLVLIVALLASRLDIPIGIIQQALASATDVDTRQTVTDIVNGMLHPFIPFRATIGNASNVNKTEASPMVETLSANRGTLNLLSNIHAKFIVLEVGACVAPGNEPMHAIHHKNRLVHVLQQIQGHYRLHQTGKDSSNCRLCESLNHRVTDFSAPSTPNQQKTKKDTWQQRLLIGMGMKNLPNHLPFVLDVDFLEIYDQMDASVMPLWLFVRGPSGYAITPNVQYSPDVPVCMLEQGLRTLYSGIRTQQKMLIRNREKRFHQLWLLYHIEVVEPASDISYSTRSFEQKGVTINAWATPHDMVTRLLENRADPVYPWNFRSVFEPKAGKLIVVLSNVNIGEFDAPIIQAVKKRRGGRAKKTRKASASTTTKSSCNRAKAAAFLDVEAVDSDDMTSTLYDDDIYTQADLDFIADSDGMDDLSPPHETIERSRRKKRKRVSCASEDDDDIPPPYAEDEEEDEAEEEAEENPALSPSHAEGVDDPSVPVYSGSSDSSDSEDGMQWVEQLEEKIQATSNSSTVQVGHGMDTEEYMATQLPWLRLAHRFFRYNKSPFCTPEERIQLQPLTAIYEKWRSEGSPSTGRSRRLLKQLVNLCAVPAPMDDAAELRHRDMVEQETRVTENPPSDTSDLIAWTVAAWKILPSELLQGGDKLGNVVFMCDQLRGGFNKRSPMAVGTAVRSILAAPGLYWYNGLLDPVLVVCIEILRAQTDAYAIHPCIGFVSLIASLVIGCPGTFRPSDHTARLLCVIAVETCLVQTLPVSQTRKHYTSEPCAPRWSWCKEHKPRVSTGILYTFNQQFNQDPVGFAIVSAVAILSDSCPRDATGQCSTSGCGSLDHMWHDQAMHVLSWLHDWLASYATVTLRGRELFSVQVTRDWTTHVEATHVRRQRNELKQYVLWQTVYAKVPGFRLLAQKAYNTDRNGLARSLTTRFTDTFGSEYNSISSTLRGREETQIDEMMASYITPHQVDCADPLWLGIFQTFTGAGLTQQRYTTYDHLKHTLDLSYRFKDWTHTQGTNVNCFAVQSRSGLHEYLSPLSENRLAGLPRPLPPISVLRTVRESCAHAWLALTACRRQLSPGCIQSKMALLQGAASAYMATVTINWHPLVPPRPSAIQRDTVSIRDLPAHDIRRFFDAICCIAEHGVTPFEFVSILTGDTSLNNKTELILAALFAAYMDLDGRSGASQHNVHGDQISQLYDCCKKLQRCSPEELLAEYCNVHALQPPVTAATSNNRDTNTIVTLIDALHGKRPISLYRNQHTYPFFSDNITQFEGGSGSVSEEKTQIPAVYRRLKRTMLGATTGFFPTAMTGCVYANTGGGLYLDGTEAGAREKKPMLYCHPRVSNCQLFGYMCRGCHFCGRMTRQVGAVFSGNKQTNQTIQMGAAHAVLPSAITVESFPPRVGASSKNLVLLQTLFRLQHTTPSVAATGLNARLVTPEWLTAFAVGLVSVVQRPDELLRWRRAFFRVTIVMLLGWRKPTRARDIRGSSGFPSPNVPGVGYSAPFTVPNNCSPSAIFWCVVTGVLSVSADGYLVPSMFSVLSMLYITSHLSPMTPPTNVDGFTPNHGTAWMQLTHHIGMQWPYAIEAFRWLALQFTEMARTRAYVLCMPIAGGMGGTHSAVGGLPEALQPWITMAACCLSSSHDAFFLLPVPCDDTSTISPLFKTACDWYIHPGRDRCLLLASIAEKYAAAMLPYRILSPLSLTDNTHATQRDIVQPLNSTTSSLFGQVYEIGLSTLQLENWQAVQLVEDLLNTVTGTTLLVVSADIIPTIWIPSLQCVDFPLLRSMPVFVFADNSRSYENAMFVDGVKQHLGDDIQWSEVVASGLPWRQRLVVVSVDMLEWVSVFANQTYFSQAVLHVNSHDHQEVVYNQASTFRRTQQQLSQIQRYGAAVWCIVDDQFSCTTAYQSHQKKSAYEHVYQLYHFNHWTGSGTYGSSAPPDVVMEATTDEPIAGCRLPFVSCSRDAAGINATIPLRWTRHPLASVSASNAWVVTETGMIARGDSGSRGTWVTTNTMTLPITMGIDKRVCWPIHWLFVTTKDVGFFFRHLQQNLLTKRPLTVPKSLTGDLQMPNIVQESLCSAIGELNLGTTFNPLVGGCPHLNNPTDYTIVHDFLSSIQCMTPGATTESLTDMEKFNSASPVLNALFVDTPVSHHTPCYTAGSTTAGDVLLLGYNHILGDHRKNAMLLFHAMLRRWVYSRCSHESPDSLIQATVTIALSGLCDKKTRSGKTTPTVFPPHLILYWYGLCALVGVLMKDKFISLGWMDTVHVIADYNFVLSSLDGHSKVQQTLRNRIPLPIYTASGEEGQRSATAHDVVDIVINLFCSPRNTITELDAPPPEWNSAEVKLWHGAVQKILSCLWFKKRHISSNNATTIQGHKCGPLQTLVPLASAPYRLCRPGSWHVKGFPFPWIFKSTRVMQQAISCIRTPLYNYTGTLTTDALQRNAYKYNVHYNALHWWFTLATPDRQVVLLVPTHGLKQDDEMARWAWGLMLFLRQAKKTNSSTCRLSFTVLSPSRRKPWAAGRILSEHVLKDPHLRPVATPNKKATAGAKRKGLDTVEYSRYLMPFFTSTVATYNAAERISTGGGRVCQLLILPEEKLKTVKFSVSNVIFIKTHPLGSDR